MSPEEFDQVKRDLYEARVWIAMLKADTILLAQKVRFLEGEVGVQAQYMGEGWKI